MHLVHLQFFWGLKHPFGIFRLKDCVDLLESMEQNGLLDMKKVPFQSLMVFTFMRGMSFPISLCDR